MNDDIMAKLARWIANDEFLTLVRRDELTAIRDKLITLDDMIERCAQVMEDMLIDPDAYRVSHEHADQWNEACEAGAGAIRQLKGNP